MDLNLVNQLAAIVKSQGLSAVEIEEGGARIRLENGLKADLTAVLPQPAASLTPPPVFPFSAPGMETQAVAAEIPVEDDYVYVNSPMVGVFRTLEKLGKKGPAPGDRVKPESIVCAVEAMKMVCEVESEREGEFVELMAADGDQVEFGQPLVKLKKV